MVDYVTYDAYCIKNNKKIRYEIQTIKDLRNRVVNTKTCSCSDNCSYGKCCCKDGNDDYIRIIGKIK